MAGKNNEIVILNRPRLQRLLDEGRNFSCTLIVADGGYGKTQTVLSYLADKDVRTGWIAATPMDNHPVHFWKKLIRNLDFHKDVKEFFIKQGFPEDLISLHQFFKLFAEEIYKGKEYYFVIDDFHVITAPVVLNFIENLIQLDMENFHMILLSRFEPGFQKLYMNKDMINRRIGMKELEFTFDEVAEYLKRKGKHISPNQLKRLFTYTEGWPLGVCLAEAYIGEGTDKEPMMPRMETKAIYQLIEQDFYNKCNEEERNALLKLSLLETFSLELLTVLVSPGVFDAFLSGNAIINIFIRYNAHTNAYQIHQFFKEFLVSRQNQLAPEEKTKAWNQVATWYETKGRLVEAQIYYWKCENWDKVWDIILASWKENPGYITKETNRLFLEIILAMPKAFIAKNPLIKVIWGSLYGSLLMLEKAKEFLQQAVSDFTAGNPSEAFRQAAGEAFIMLGFYSIMLGEDDFYIYYQKAAEYLPNGSQIFRKGFMVMQTDTVLSLRTGDGGEIERRLAGLYKTAPYHVSVLNGCGFGLEFMGEAEAHYYQGNMKKAEEYAYRAIYKGKTMEQVDIVCNAYFILVRIGIYNGNYKEITKNLTLLREYAEGHLTSDFYGMPDVAEGWFFARMGHIDRVADWIRDGVLYEHMEVPMAAGREMVVKGFCYLAKKNHQEHLDFLDSAETAYESKGQSISLISIKIQKAIVFYWLGNYNQAAAYLESVYQLAGKNHIIMPAVGYGKYICQLIDYIKSGKGVDIPEAWIDHIYSKAAVYSKRITYLRAEYEKEQNYYSADRIDLEPGEIRILMGLYKGMTREEIANSLLMPMTSVKYALKNIYGKLGAINGVHAVQIALVKGLIKDERE